MSKYRSTLILILIILILKISSIYFIFFKPNILLNKNSQRFNIYPTYNFDSIVNNLKTKEILNNNFTFKIASKILRYGSNIYTGSYYFTTNMNNLKAIRMLKGGLQKPIKIIIYDIKDKKSLVEKISNNLLIQNNELIKLLDDNQFLQSFGFNSENVLSIFIPNTYELYWNISAKRLFKKFYMEYEKFWNNERIEKCKQMKLSKIEVSILASIVQAETCKDSEAPIIAGVYYNRLKKGIRLQADPTLKHANCKNNATRVLDKYKLIDSPYNTYKYKGLPPGPINVPKIIFIDAVLNYKKHRYLYMAAKEDFSGEHYFSEKYSKHIIYARKYRAALNRLKIYN